MERKTINPAKLFVCVGPPEWLWPKKGLSLGAKACYGRIIHYGRASGEFYVSKERLAEDMGVSVRQVRNYVRELEDICLLNEVRAARGKPTSFEFNFHPWVEEAIGAEGSFRDGKIVPSPRKDSSVEGGSDIILGTIKNNSGESSHSHPDAEAIYQAYPRKTGKPSALRAINAAIRRACKSDPSWLLERTKAYARSVSGKDVTFIPYPATWFRDDRFNDLTDPSPFATPPKAASCAAKLGVTNTPKEARIFE